MTLRSTWAAVRDVVDDGLAGVAARPGRTLLTIAGTILGIASLVVTSGVAASAAANVSATFDAYKATEVVLRDNVPMGAAVAPSRLDELAKLRGVRAAGMICDLSSAGITIGASGASLGSSNDLDTVMSMSVGGLAGVRPHWREGGGFTRFEEQREAHVAVVGIGVARALNLPDESVHPMILLNGVEFAIVGVLDDVKRQASALNAVIVPSTTAQRLFSQTCPTPLEVLVETKPGATDAVGALAPLIVSPEQTSRFSVDIPPDPRLLRKSVEGDVTALYAALAVISLLVGSLSIGNTMTVAVLERRAEIGLRRSLGFRRRDIGTLIAGESVIAGGLGGLIGTSVGVGVVLAVAAFKGWTPTFDTQLLLVGPAAGALTGFLGGIVPAVRAARIEPARAVRL